MLLTQISTRYKNRSPPKCQQNIRIAPHPNVNKMTTLSAAVLVVNLNPSKKLSLIKFLPSLDTEVLNFNFCQIWGKFKKCLWSLLRFLIACVCIFKKKNCKKFLKKLYLNLIDRLNYHDKKIQQTLTHNIWKQWTAVLTLLSLVSSVYRDLHNWRSNLCAIWTRDLVVEFRLCNLRSLVQFPVVEITVYTADEL